MKNTHAHSLLGNLDCVQEIWGVLLVLGGRGSVDGGSTVAKTPLQHQNVLTVLL